MGGYKSMRKVMKKMVLTMAALALLEDLANGAIRRERVFREREDLLANDDNWLMSRFRLPRPVLLELCAELRPALEPNVIQVHQIPIQCC